MSINHRSTVLIDVKSFDLVSFTIILIPLLFYLFFFFPPDRRSLPFSPWSRLVFTRCPIHLFLRLVKEGEGNCGSSFRGAALSHIETYKIDKFLRGSLRSLPNGGKEKGRDRVTEATGIYVSATSIREETASSTAGQCTSRDRGETERRSSERCCEVSRGGTGFTGHYLSSA